jgi:hypothetical protein
MGKLLSIASRLYCFVFAPLENNVVLLAEFSKDFIGDRSSPVLIISSTCNQSHGKTSGG